MKKFLFSIPLVIVALFALAAGAWAETGDIVATINQDFVASGQLHPAGTYKVRQVSAGALMLRSQETGASVFLLPAVHDDALRGRQLEVKLRRAGDSYYLSEVVTDLGVYSFTTPKALTRMAKTKDHGLMTASGSN
ncbi:MAG TPA: hypothetical protein VFA89_11260 [Terriglobales bacterium]|nr:hypothetical protein [Terriglobales bacterium]